MGYRMLFEIGKRVVRAFGVKFVRDPSARSGSHLRDMPFAA